MLTRKIAYWLGFIPFKLNFFVLAFIFGMIFYYTKSTYLVGDIQESQKLIFELIFKLFGWFVAIVIGFALLTLIISWAYMFMVKASSKNNFLKINFGVDGYQADAGKVPFVVSFNGLIRPLLGSIKARVLFKDLASSTELQLNENQHTKSKFLRSGVYSADGLILNDRRQYSLEKVVIFYEDMFRLFSLPYVLDYSKNVYTVPPFSTYKELTLQPNKATEQTVKIDTPQRTKGELFNYKNFESGDDIRRIVWKIFAKNKELVVRVPELMDTQASELLIFTSFYSTIAKINNSAFGQFFNNYYKDRLRVIYETAKTNGFAIKHQPDQHVDESLIADADKTLYNISLSKWQNDNSIVNYLGNKKGGVLCISSLTDAQELENLLSGPEAAFYTIFYTKLSLAFKNKLPLNFWNILVVAEEKPETVLKRKWLLSPLKSSIQKNEAALEKILNNCTAKTFNV